MRKNTSSLSTGSFKNRRKQAVLYSILYYTTYHSRGLSLALEDGQGKMEKEVGVLL
jgi:hypothetical protein